MHVLCEIRCVCAQLGCHALNAGVESCRRLTSGWIKTKDYEELKELDERVGSDHNANNYFAR